MQISRKVHEPQMQTCMTCSSRSLLIFFNFLDLGTQGNTQDHNINKAAETNQNNLVVCI